MEDLILSFKFSFYKRDALVKWIRYVPFFQIFLRVILLLGLIPICINNFKNIKVEICDFLSFFFLEWSEPLIVYLVRKLIIKIKIWRKK